MSGQYPKGHISGLPAVSAVATGDEIELNDKSVDGTSKKATIAQLYQRVLNEVTDTTYTTVLTDAWPTILRLTNASAITLTIPPNSSVAYPIGTVLEIFAGSTGRITVTEGSGVTFNSPTGNTVMNRTAGSRAYLVKVDTDTWDAFGDFVPCSFQVSLSNTISNVIGVDDTLYQVAFDNSEHNLVNAYSLVNDEFTAPVNGEYQFNAAARISGITSAADRMLISLVNSGADYPSLSQQNTNLIPEAPTLQISALLKMDAGDTCHLQLEVEGEASNVVDVVGTSNFLITYFDGHLVR